MRSAPLILRNAVTIAAGLVVASGVAAAAFALLSADIRMFTPAFVVIAVVALVLGMPVYLVARAQRNDTPLVAAVMGFLVGALIPAILIFSGPAADEASVGETPTVVNGAYTLAGWLQGLAFIGFFGVLGLCGGMVFWRIVRRRGPSAAEGKDRPSPPPLRTALLSLAAAGVIGAAFYIPEATADRSCHNPLRDGSQSIGQVASFDLRVGVDQWQDVAREVEAFRSSGDWSVRSDVRTDESFPWLQISLCKEPGTNIVVQGFADFKEVSFGIYQPQGGSSWRRDFRTLYGRIKARWPSQIAFKDAHGSPATAPEWVGNQQEP